MVKNAKNNTSQNKFSHRENRVPTSKQKFLAQLLVSVFVTVYAISAGVIDNEVVIPFIKQPLNLGIFGSTKYL